MRPGQTAPECASSRAVRDGRSTGFNEAGADCPGMPDEMAAALRRPAGFNEAGADCPGMHFPARRKRKQMQLLQ